MNLGQLCRYQKSSWGKGQLHKAGNLTAICELSVRKYVSLDLSQPYGLQEPVKEIPLINFIAKQNPHLPNLM
jgi:hypothetical protein